MINDIRKGDLVKALPPKIGNNIREFIWGEGKTKPDWMPEPGTIGKVIKLKKYQGGASSALVMWPDGSTNYYEECDTWWIPITWLEKVDICCIDSQKKQAL